MANTNNCTIKYTNQTTLFSTSPTSDVMFDGKTANKLTLLTDNKEILNKVRNITVTDSIILGDTDATNEIQNPLEQVIFNGISNETEVTCNNISVDELNYSEGIITMADGRVISSTSSNITIKNNGTLKVVGGDYSLHQRELLRNSLKNLKSLK